MAQTGHTHQGPAATDVDKYPTLNEALRRLLKATTEGNTTIERVTIRAQANGELSYKVRPARADEDEVGIVRAGE